MLSSQREAYYQGFRPAQGYRMHLCGETAESAIMLIGTETVLLVEDEDAVRELTAEILTSCGYTVLQAANGQEAMALLSKQKMHIPLLVSDVVMPYMGGRELADQAIKLVPTMGILFLSGYMADAQMRESVLKAECAFLQKPFTLMDLAQKVREVLDRQ